jgi:hypothetical protein
MPCAVDNGEDDNLIAIIEDFVHNEVWRFDEFTRAFDKARTPHTRKRIQLKPIDPVLNPPDHISRGAGIILRDPRKNTIKIILRRGADNDSHSP